MCGDGVVTMPVEVCDDGNTAGGDGCDAACGAVEPGFTCPTGGEPCAPVVCEGADVPDDCSVCSGVCVCVFVCLYEKVGVCVCVCSGVCCVCCVFV